jgi:hypothetical protein
MKKVQCLGGTLQGEANPTWLKQPSDRIIAGVGAVIAGVGFVKVCIGSYRLASGKGKIED